MPAHPGVAPLTGPWLSTAAHSAPAVAPCTGRPWSPDCAASRPRQGPDSHRPSTRTCEGRSYTCSHTRAREHMCEHTHAHIHSGTLTQTRVPGHTLHPAPRSALPSDSQFQLCPAEPHPGTPRARSGWPRIHAGGAGCRRWRPHGCLARVTSSRGSCSWGVAPCVSVSCTDGPILTDWAKSHTEQCAQQTAYVENKASCPGPPRRAAPHHNPATLWTARTDPGWLPRACVSAMGMHHSGPHTSLLVFMAVAFQTRDSAVLVQVAVHALHLPSIFCCVNAPGVSLVPGAAEGPARVSCLCLGSS